jgi:hypothetical protein
VSHRKGYPLNIAVMKSSETPPMACLKACRIGAWLSPARALGSGPRGREFESPRPDKEKANMMYVRLFYFRFAFLWTVAGSNR